MKRFIQICDIPDKDGITDRERNIAMVHSFKVGDLVELDDGCRLFICRLSRDCDQTPLYQIGREDSNRQGGYPEGYLKFIRSGDLK